MLRSVKAGDIQAWVSRCRQAGCADEALYQKLEDRQGIWTALWPRILKIPLSSSDTHDSASRACISQHQVLQDWGVGGWQQRCRHGEGQGWLLVHERGQTADTIGQKKFRSFSPRHRTQQLSVRSHREAVITPYHNTLSVSSPFWDAFPSEARNMLLGGKSIRV